MKQHWAVLVFAAALGVALVASRGHSAPPDGAAPKGDKPATSKLPAPRVPAPERANRGAPTLPLRRRVGAEDDSPDRSPLAVDRQMLRLFETADESIAKNDVAEGTRLLERILENPADSWIETAGPDGAHFHSAKRQAMAMIGRLPRAARASYETEFGQTARQMLADATERGDVSLLEEVVRRYFHTKAGYEASYQLGGRLLDASMPLSAAVQFEMLRNSSAGDSYEPMLSLKTACCWMRSGAPKKSLAILAVLKQKTKGATLTIGGRKATLFQRDADALEWLAAVMGPPPAAVVPHDWPVFGGSAARNAESGEGLPLGKPVWSHSTVRDGRLVGKDRLAEIETALKNYETELADLGVVTMPTAVPLVVGRTAVFRTLARLRAVDVDTGAPLWDQAESDWHFRILAAAGDPKRPANRLSVSMSSNEQSDLRLFLNARSFRDMTYGSLSSDGRRVFALLEMGFLGQGDLRTSPQPEFLGARQQNVLACIDLATGELLWEIGGSRRDRGRPLAGTFFLGPPLPVGNLAFCLGELDGEISLHALEPATGKRAWSQPIAIPLGRLPHFPLRRLAGGSPSDAGGLLVCPTTGGVVVGFDPSSRTLQWDYQYPINVVQPDFPDPRVWWVDEPLDTGDDETSRWLDASPTIADGCVILTPRDSDHLHCVDLADGALRWKRDRGNGLFVATVVDGMIVVVGRSTVEALRLSDGTPVWKQPVALPMPAGRGFRHGRLYHLPLSTGEFATIDLNQGRVLTRSKLPDGVEPGNLLSAAGTTIVQSASSVKGFRPLAEREGEIAAALKKSPDDPAALAARGEIRLHRGEMQAGLDDLLRSARVHRDARVQELAVATVLENLRFDFAAGRATALAIEPLIAEVTQRLEFHRLMATGLERLGDVPGAFEHLLRLVDFAIRDADLVAADESRKARVSQVIAPLLGDLYKQANAAQRADLQKQLDAQLASLRDEEHVARLKAAVECFRMFPAQSILRRVIVERLTQPQDHPEHARQLNVLRTADDPAVAGRATARLARLLIDRGRIDDAKQMLRDLREKFANVACADGKTGGEFARAWGSEPRVRDSPSRSEPWPEMHLSVNRRDESRPVHAVAPVRVDERAGPFFRGWRFEAQAATNGGFVLVAVDERGLEQWRLEMGVHNLGDDAEGDAPVAVRIHGHLMQLVLHRRFAVLDLMQGAGPPKFLWSRELYDPRRSSAFPQNRPDEGIAGPIGDEFVFYQVGSVLTCADAITGDVLWERRNIPFGSVYHGDDEYLVAVNRHEPNDAVGFVLRAFDGAEVFVGRLGAQGVVPVDWRGRRMVTFSRQPELTIASLTDAATRQVVWSREFPKRSSSAAIDDEEFAVVDPDGKFHVYSLETGVSIVEGRLPPTDLFSQVVVRRVVGRYVIVRINPRQPVVLPRQDATRSAPNALVSAVDRATGKTLWNVPMTATGPPVEAPAESPVLVFLRAERRRSSGGPIGIPVTLSVLDTRTGQTIFENQESVPPDRFAVRVVLEPQKVLVVTDGFQLAIMPTAVPLSSRRPIVPIVAPRPAPR